MNLGSIFCPNYLFSMSSSQIYYRNSNCLLPNIFIFLNDFVQIFIIQFFFFYLVASDLRHSSLIWLLIKKYLRCEHKTKNKQFLDKFWRHLLLSKMIFDFQNWANWCTILKCLFQLYCLTNCGILFPINQKWNNY